MPRMELAGYKGRSNGSRRFIPIVPRIISPRFGLYPEFDGRIFVYSWIDLKLPHSPPDREFREICETCLRLSRIL